MKKVLGILLAVVVVGGGAYAALRWARAGSSASSGAEPAATVAGPVKAGNQVTVEGQVVPVRTTDLGFATGGTVAEVLVKEGDHVQPGQVLARLNAGRQAAAMAQAEADVRRAQARLAEIQAGARPQEIAAARAGVEAAQAGLDRLRQDPTEAEIAAVEAEIAQAKARLLAEQQRPAPVVQDLEAASAGLNAARARLERLRQGATAAELAQAEAQVRSAQAQLDLRLAGARSESIATAQADLAAALPQVDLARAALAEVELRAPIAGTVAVLDLKVGQSVAPGAPVVHLADLSAWQVETDDLTELQVGRVREGGPVKLKFDAIPDLELAGTATRIKTLGEKKQGDITYTVIITPEKQDERLRWNMTATATFEGP